MGKDRINRIAVLRKQIEIFHSLLCWKYLYFKSKGNVIILLPECTDRELYYYFLYMDRVCQKGQKIYLITSSKKIYSWSSELLKKLYKRKKISPRKMDKLILAYPELWFRDQIIVASLDKPIGRNGYHLLGKEGITLEELIAVGLLKIKNGYYNKELRPKKIRYEGNKEEIKQFVKENVEFGNQAKPAHIKETT